MTGSSITLSCPNPKTRMPASADREALAEAVGVVFSSADAMEGPIAFAEKRPPNWQGK